MSYITPIGLGFALLVSFSVFAYDEQVQPKSPQDLENQRNYIAFYNARELSKTKSASQIVNWTFNDINENRGRVFSQASVWAKSILRSWANRNRENVLGSLDYINIESLELENSLQVGKQRLMNDLQVYSVKFKKCHFDYNLGAIFFEEGEVTLRNGLEFCVVFPEEQTLPGKIQAKGVVAVDLTAESSVRPSCLWEVGAVSCKEETARIAEVIRSLIEERKMPSPDFWKEEIARIGTRQYYQTLFSPAGIFLEDESAGFRKYCIETGAKLKLSKNGKTCP